MRFVELLKRGPDKFKQVIPGGSGVPGLFIFLMVVVLRAIIAFYAFTFRVNPDEIGIVLYLGKPNRALLRPYFLNQFTVTHCEVRFAQHG